MRFRSYISSLLIVTLSLSTFFFAQTTQAQSVQELLSSVQNDIRIQTIPQFPQANESVTITLISYSTDLDRSVITWQVDGQTVLSGTGEKELTTTVGTLGSTESVVATIKTTLGAVLKRNVTLSPADIDIVWQATSMVPPLYAGKAMMPHQGLITFTAIPNFGKEISFADTKKYVFKWLLDGDIEGDYSGYGKNVFAYRGDVISRTFNVEVDVSDMSGAVIGKGSVNITPQSPEVGFYQSSPLYGPLFNQSLSSVNLKNKELTLLAVPYFINTPPEDTNLQYDWTLNDSPIPKQTDPKKLTLRATTELSGTAIIAVQVSNLSKILQFGSNSMSVDFNTQ